MQLLPTLPFVSFPFFPPSLPLLSAPAQLASSRTASAPRRPLQHPCEISDTPRFSRFSRFSLPGRLLLASLCTRTVKSYRVAQLGPIYVYGRLRGKRERQEGKEWRRGKAKGVERYEQRCFTSPAPRCASVAQWRRRKMWECEMTPVLPPSRRAAGKKRRKKASTLLW